MWQDLWVALALVLVIEGMLPFASPGRFRTMLQLVSTMDDKAVRKIGLFSMLGGLLLLYLVR